jgi:hypothetical protein
MGKKKLVLKHLEKAQYKLGYIEQKYKDLTRECENLFTKLEMTKLDGLARYTAFIDLFEIKKLNLLRSQGMVNRKLGENKKYLEKEPEEQKLVEGKEK